MIGQSPRRREDERLLAGRGRFVDDIRLPGLLHLVVVRSIHARARLLRVDLTGARAQPGVLAFAATDLPELDAPLPVRGAETTNPYVVLDTPRPQHVLARGEVRHVGEAIAAVLAPDPYRAADAAEAAAIEYEPLPAVLDAGVAMRDDAPRVHEGQDNVVGRLRAVIGDVDAAFAEADVVVEDALAHVRVSSMAIEPRAVCAALDADGEGLTVWAGHQNPYALRAAIASYLGLSLERRAGPRARHRRRIRREDRGVSRGRARSRPRLSAAAARQVDPDAHRVHAELEPRARATAHRAARRLRATGACSRST